MVSASSVGAADADAAGELAAGELTAGALAVEPTAEPAAEPPAPAAGPAAELAADDAAAEALEATAAWVLLPAEAAVTVEAPAVLAGADCSGPGTGVRTPVWPALAELTAPVLRAVVALLMASVFLEVDTPELEALAAEVAVAAAELEDAELDAAGQVRSNRGVVLS